MYKKIKEIDSFSFTVFPVRTTNHTFYIKHTHTHITSHFLWTFLTKYGSFLNCTQKTYILAQFFFHHRRQRSSHIWNKLNGWRLKANAEANSVQLSFLSLTKTKLQVAFFSCCSLHFHNLTVFSEFSGKTISCIMSVRPLVGMK